MESIYHIATEIDWKAAQESGSYWPPGIPTQDGFLHLSPKNQLEWVGKRFFKGKLGLCLLEVAPDRLRSSLRYDPVPERGISFPHLYGPLNLDAVVSVRAYFVKE